MKQLLVVLFAFLIGCKSGDKKFDEVSYEKQKETLEQKERKNPERFIRVEGDYNKNIIGQTVVKMKLINDATIVSYKNVRVKMLFYDKEKNLFENHEEILEKQVKPGSSVKLKSKYFAQRRTDSIAFSIMSAVDVE